MKTIIKTGLMFGICLFSASLLGAADAPTNAVTASAHSPAPPRINGPKIFGVRPDSPFLFTIPATGERPMKFSADKLPRGLKLDSASGIITGALEKRGEFNVTLRAKNKLGGAEKSSASSWATLSRSRRRWAGTVGIVSPVRCLRNA